MKNKPKTWDRKCPNCKECQKYKRHSAYVKAKKTKRICVKCQHKHAAMDGNFIRHCNTCKTELRYFSLTNLKRAETTNGNCNKCDGLLKSGENNPSKRPEVRKKIGDTQRIHNFPSRVKLECDCGRTWQVSRFRYIRGYINIKKKPECIFCRNQRIADNMSQKTRNRSNKLKSIRMKGRKITWVDKIAETRSKKSKKELAAIGNKISKTKSERIANGEIKFNTSFISGYYKSKKSNKKEYYHSSWELMRMTQLDSSSDVLEWTKNHNIRIEYKHKGKIHRYIPDFLIKYKSESVIEEIKGFIHDKRILKLKCKAAVEYCKKYGYRYTITYDKPSKNKTN